MPDAVLVGLPHRRANRDNELNLGELGVLSQPREDRAPRPDLARDRAVEVIPAARLDDRAQLGRKLEPLETEPASSEALAQAVLACSQGKPTARASRKPQSA